MTLWLLWGCVNDEIFFHRVEVTGSILSDTTDAPIWLSAHHAWFGEGLLRYPASEFDSTMFPSSGEFSWTIDVPIVEDASGLLIYGWQDVDDDGVFCGLDGSEEYSDLVSIEEYPTFSATIALHLNRLCKASEKLWSEEGIPE